MTSRSGTTSGKSPPSLSRGEFTLIIPDEVAIYLGHITSRWSLIEEVLAEIIQKLTGHEDRVGRAITAELSTIQRVSLIGALIDCANFHETLALWRLTIKVVDDLRNFRNEVVHGVWAVHPQYNFVLRNKAKGRQVEELSVWQPAILKKLLTMHEDCLELLKSFKDVIDETEIADVLKSPPDAPDQLDTRPPSPASQLQAQARAQKKAKREADRARSRTQKKPEAP